jgi:glycosyltransferase involved in cell wall biosynthesis
MTSQDRSRRPLRIVHTESSLGWGGQEIRILVEAAGMISRGHEVSLVCPAEAAIYQEARERGIPVTALPIARRDRRGFAAVRNWLRDARADVINTHSSTDSWLVSLAARTIRRRPGIVRTRHISPDVARDPLTRWLYGRGADRLVTTGERLRQSFLTRLRLPSDHVISIPTGIDTDHFAPGDRQEACRRLGLPADRLIVGIVATIRSWKGHVYLIDALSELPQKEQTLLLVVGDGPSRHFVEERIVQRGLAGSVRMVGQQRDVAPWLQAMDVFALPSYANEGVPQSIMQAMSCGLPVVSTHVGSVDEAATHEKTGLLVAPKDATALGAALERLLADPSLRRRMGEAGRRAATADFTFSRMIDRMEEVFYRAVRGEASAGIAAEGNSRNTPDTVALQPAAGAGKERFLSGSRRMRNPPAADAQRPPISAAIICCNEERNIERCLEAVRWCEQIVVVDSGSSDRTREIAARFPAEVHVRPFDTFINQKNYALDCCRHEWVLSVDADEVITPALADEMQRLRYDVSGYLLRRNNFLGDRVFNRGKWLNDFHLRLFRKSQGRWGGSNPHERVVLSGPTQRLRTHMLHYSYRDRRDFLQRNRKYTEMLADYLAREGRSTYPGEPIFHAAGNFLDAYFVRRGFLDGETGLFLAYHYARFSYLKYAWLAERRQAEKDADPPSRRAA